MTSFYEIIFYPALCLAPVIIASGFCTALLSLGKLHGKDVVENKTHFLYISLFKAIGSAHFWELLLFSTQITKFLYYLIFGFVSFFFLFISESAQGSKHIEQLGNFSFYASSSLEILLILLLSIFVEIFLTLIIEKRAEKAVKILSFPSAVLMIPCIPFIFFYSKCKGALTSSQKPIERLPENLKNNLLECLAESEIGRYLEKTEIKLIRTVISFKDRIVREVMVPRINIFSLASDTTIRQAVQCFSKEGYSRIPVYKENADKIIGVLLYKDILSIYVNHIEKKDPEKSLEKTVEHLLKPTLYTPETKKIAHLLQEFKNKQIHLAIVVNEYGGTEGIVTIEDILEELVGEIEDEHDVQEAKTYVSISSGEWIVDAKMSILDLEDDLNIKIPQSFEYDTIGGYIFQRTGAIPSKGWKGHLDDLDLEVLSSDERSIHKIKITQRQHKTTK